MQRWPLHEAFPKAWETGQSSSVSQAPVQVCPHRGVDLHFGAASLHCESSAQGSPGASGGMLTIASTSSRPSVAMRKPVPPARPVSVAEFPLGTIEAWPLSQSSDQATGFGVPVIWATTVTLCPSPTV